MQSEYISTSIVSFSIHFHLNQLNDGHLCVVSLTGNGSQDTSVSSFAVGITIRGGFKEGMDKVLVVHPCHGLATSVQVSTLSKLDHVVNVLSDSSGANQSSLDASMSDNLSGKCTKQSLALISRLSELVESLSV
jgi:hypothetical protein